MSLLFRMLAVCLFLGWAFGCSSEKETLLPPPVEPKIEKPAETPVNFSTNTDTVSSSQAIQRIDTVVVLRDPQVRFMVQIGAYKEAENASRIQAIARDRYKMPVLNDYNPTLMLYQIRLGFFETRESATAFRDRMKREFPEDYGDAWVAQLTQ